MIEYTIDRSKTFYENMAVWMKKQLKENEVFLKSLDN